MDTDRRPSYLKLAENVQDMIANGQFMPGSKLPSLRNFAQLHSISMNTAKAAYEHLVSLGVIIGIERSGYVVEANFPDRLAKFEIHQEEPVKSVINADEAWSWYRSQDSSNIDNSLAVISPHPDLMPSRAIARIHGGIFTQLGDKISAYANSKGVRELREAISLHLQTREFYIGYESIQITNGCMHAIELVLSVLCQKGDQIVVITPCFPGYLAMLNNLGLKIIELPLLKGKIDFDKLDYYLAQEGVKAALLSAISQNPTGYSLKEKEKNR